MVSVILRYLLVNNTCKDQLKFSGVVLKEVDVVKLRYPYLCPTNIRNQEGYVGSLDVSSTHTFEFATLQC